MDKIKVMIVADDERGLYDIRHRIKHDSLAVVGLCKSDALAVNKIRNEKPHIALIRQDEATISLCEKIDTSISDCTMIVLCEAIDPAFMEQAMSVGVRKVLQWKMEPVELAEQLVQVYEKEKTRIQNLGLSSASRSARVVTIFGTKGGVGKTMMTANLAVLLAKKGNKVAVIDADLQFGDVHMFFSVETKDTLAELSKDREMEDIDAIRRVSVLHATGVQLICAPKSPEYAEYVTASGIESMITAMRPYFDYIVIDTTPLFTDVTITAIENANVVLLVTGLDISSLRNTKTGLQVLETLQQTDKVEIVINRASKDGFSIKHIRRLLQDRVAAAIPLDMKAALAAHNKGVPVVIDSPRSGLSKQLANLSNHIYAKLQ